jgi:hypothetical protein
VKIRKRGKTWQITVMIDGKRVQKSLKTADRETARIRAKVFELEHKPSEEIHRITLPEFRAQYLEWSKSRKPASYENERKALSRLEEVLPLIHFLEELTPVIADRFVTKILEPREVLVKGEKKTVTMQPGGVNFYIRTLRAIFTQAVTWRFIGSNPFAKLRLMSYSPRGYSPRMSSSRSSRSSPPWRRSTWISSSSTS